MIEEEPGPDHPAQAPDGTRTAGDQGSGDQGSGDQGGGPPHRDPPVPPDGFDAGNADRDAAIAHLFATHYHGLLRLAFLLGADGDTEDVVAEAFYQLHRRWGRLRTPDAALGYLRGTVCNMARMRLRHLRVVRKHTHHHVERLELSAETQALIRDEHRLVAKALAALPARQHQVLVLRYWLDLKEAEIAEIMGISPGAVKSHASRGMARLSRILKGA
ncbi:SigE family RNA polymerase sigma factor [Kitasatospora sp. NPDC056181]|uniref:SigE family RNA polymerase sigma factor n=1 Tax=Kitasatospora sp. NPDC056181 TaxID=3345737 RepID=UPI0035DF374D